MSHRPPHILYLDSHDHATCLKKFAGTRRFAAAVGGRIVRKKITDSPTRLKALLARLKARGLRVPEYVALIAADDTEAAAAADLTSIRIDFEQGGYLAAKCLLESLNGRRPPHAVFFGDICIRPRPSTHHFARHLPKISAAVALIRERAAAGLHDSLSTLNA